MNSKGFFLLCLIHVNTINYGVLNSSGKKWGKASKPSAHIRSLSPYRDPQPTSRARLSTFELL